MESINSEDILKDLDDEGSQGLIEDAEEDIIDKKKEKEEEEKEKESEPELEIESEELKRREGKSKKQEKEKGKKRVKREEQEGEEEEEQEDKQKRVGCSKASRRRGEVQVSDKVIELEVQQVITLIEEAMNKDILSNQHKQPAVQRLQSMKTLENKLRNKQIQQMFLQMNGLDHLEKYLFQLPDGSRPSSLLKQKVLELLRLLRLEAHHIKHNHLGQKIMAITEDNKENTQVQKIALLLVEDWTRILMDNHTDYKKQALFQDIKINKQQQQSQYQSQSQQPLMQQQQYNKKDIHSKTLLPPKGKQLAFAINPQSIKIRKCSKQMSDEAKSISKLLTDLKKKKNQC